MTTFTRIVLWLNRGDNSMLAAGFLLMPIFVAAMIGLFGAPQ